MKFILYIAGIILLFGSCKTGGRQGTDIVDEGATPETRELLVLLKSVPSRGFFVGHQDATAYGVGWNYGEGANVSDMKRICGDYPSVYGFDIGMVEYDWMCNLDTVNFRLMHQLIREASEREGVITISWHVRNPVTDENAWSQTPAIPQVLTNDTIRTKFTRWLRKAAAFFLSLKDEDGNLIPVLFRPWHEWSGDWFWWGNKHCTDREFIDFWKLTVTTLRDSLNVHNLLYAFSSGSCKDEEEFLRKYPGDDFVDLIGVDLYVYNDDLDFYREEVSRNLTMLKKIGKEHDKPYALTETGYESIPDTTWFSETVYPLIRESGISYVLFWRNDNPKHHYVPYPGHRAARDFKRFYDFRETLFNNDIK